MKKHIISAVLLCCVIFAANSIVLAQRQSMPEYQLRELRDAVRGVNLSEERAANLWEIYRQLQDYSGMFFPIVMGQTFQWGQAHAGGAIILDYSIAAKDKDIAAFVMAHEYGHQVLGHQPNFYRPEGGPWRFRPSPTADEDAADEYAGAFLARYDYNICAVGKFLERTPRIPNGDSHSDGPERARIVKEVAGVDDCDDQRPPPLEKITFTIEINPIQVGALGAEVEIWIDDKRVGMVSNMESETSIEVNSFVEGRHNWRLRAKVYRFNGYTPVFYRTMVGSGSATFTDNDTFLIKGYSTNMTLEKQ
jgi:hypothetical protein